MSAATALPRCLTVRERWRMSFDTPAGTRGTRIPRSSGRVSRWMGRWMTNQPRRKGYTFMGMDVLFLTTIGRRTGQRRETPVAWFPDGEDAWLIVASAAGTARTPGRVDN